MAVSLNALKKVTKEELSNMVLEYQNKFDNNSSAFVNNTWHLSILIQGYEVSGVFLRYFKGI